MLCCLLSLTKRCECDLKISWTRWSRLSCWQQSNPGTEWQMSIIHPYALRSTRRTRSSVGACQSTSPPSAAANPRLELRCGWMTDKLGGRGGGGRPERRERCQVNESSVWEGCESRPQLTRQGQESLTCASCLGVHVHPQLVWACAQQSQRVFDSQSGGAAAGRPSGSLPLPVCFNCM